LNLSVPAEIPARRADRRAIILSMLSARERADEPYTRCLRRGRQSSAEGARRVKGAAAPSARWWARAASVACSTRRCIFRNRIAITRALESGLSHRQMQMMSKHKAPKTVMRYDRGRENLEQNAVNFLAYDEE
jgi:hypothetical protein